MGGRGSSSSSGGGGTGGVNAGDILDTTSLVSAREIRQKEVDEVLSVFNDVYNEYGSQVTDIHIALMDSKSHALAYYDSGDNIAVNAKYFNSATMNKAMVDSIAAGYHPKMGNKTAMQAVVAHELGHKLTADVATKLNQAGFGNLNTVAGRIVREAKKKIGYKNSDFAAKISGYAKTNHAETVAEAYCDVYCNGGKAKRESRAIVDVINGYLK